jgi:hypothetical protein
MSSDQAEQQCIQLRTLLYSTIMAPAWPEVEVSLPDFENWLHTENCRKQQKTDKHTGVFIELLHI